MWNEVLLFLEQFRGQKIYVACSSGVDSMVLTHFLFVNGFDIHVLHVNYHKRGVESDKDMLHVQDFCLKNAISFDYIDYESKEKGNFQENARKFRYQYFESFAQNSDDLIALGHHADDQVETFFMNLTRQAGVLGLSCIPQKREKFLRPFLSIPKNELIKYALENKVEWREDASNTTSNYMRNIWRLEYIPLMEQHVPNLKSSVLTLVNVFQQTQRSLEQKIAPICKQIERTNQLSVDLYNQLDDSELYELWRQLKQPSSIFHRFLELYNYQIGKCIELVYPYEKIIRKKEHLYFEKVAKEVKLPTIHAKIVYSLPTHFDKNTLYLDASKIKGELILRPWTKEDKISSLGMKSKQSVTKIIKNAKFTTSEKENSWVLCDDVHIHCVVGLNALLPSVLKIGREAIANRETKVILRVEVG